MNRKMIKTLIELSTTFEKADEVISKYTDFETVKEKIAFLKGMFDVEIIDQGKDDSDEFIYRIILESIVREKFC